MTSLSSFNKGKKSAEDTLQTLKLLMDHGLRELINEPDSLGNTPLHALIVRYALEVEICELSLIEWGAVIFGTE